MKKENLLVLGGFGYIGSHFVVEALQSGYDVTVVDNGCNCDIDSVYKAIIEICGKNEDSGDLLFVKSSIEDLLEHDIPEGIKTCIDFAGLKAVGESCNEPIKYFRNNISQLIEVLETLDKSGIKNIVFSSSATVYNGLDKLTERSSLGPTNPYGTTKLVSEMLIEDMVKFKGFKAINLRYFNPVGAHESGLLGEFTDKPNNLLPIIAEVLYGKREKLTIFGDDYDTMDGTCERDYIGVNDLVAGHLQAIALFNKGTVLDDTKKSLNINLGTGVPQSVYEFIELCEQASGEKIDYEIGEKREGDKPRFFAESVFAKQIIGFETKEILLDSIKNYFEFYKNKVK